MKKKMISAFALILALSTAVRAQEAPCPRRATERNAVRRPNKGETSTKVTSTKVRIDEKSGSPYFF